MLSEWSRQTQLVQTVYEAPYVHVVMQSQKPQLCSRPMTVALVDVQACKAPPSKQRQSARARTATKPPVETGQRQRKTPARLNGRDFCVDWVESADHQDAGAGGEPWSQVRRELSVTEVVLLAHRALIAVHKTCRLDSQSMRLLRAGPVCFSRGKHSPQHLQ